MNMIEKVARSIAYQLQENKYGKILTEWEEFADNHKIEMSCLAKAAIAAMREPTEEMIEALLKSYPDHVIECYQSMTDAALKE